MDEKAGLKMVAEFEKVEKLIANGELPDVPGLWPRVAYLGHEVVHCYGTYGDAALYRCVECKEEFTGHNGVCPKCQKDDETYQLNHNRSARWRCKSCKHEWDGEDGQTCPACGKVEK